MIDTKFSRILFLWCFFVEDCWSCDRRNWLIHVLLLVVLFWNWHIILNLTKTFYMNMLNWEVGMYYYINERILQERVRHEVMITHPTTWYLIDKSTEWNLDLVIRLNVPHVIIQHCFYTSKAQRFVLFCFVLTYQGTLVHYKLLVVK